jgi:hypothetical protein
LLVKTVDKVLGLEGFPSQDPRILDELLLSGRRCWEGKISSRCFKAEG